MVFVSWAIRRFDESDVDRAAIVLRPETMAEATASGLRQVAIEPAGRRQRVHLRSTTHDRRRSVVRCRTGAGVLDRSSPHERSDRAARRPRHDQEAPDRRANAQASPLRRARSGGGHRRPAGRAGWESPIRLGVRASLLRTNGRPPNHDRGPRGIRPRPWTPLGPTHGSDEGRRGDALGLGIPHPRPGASDREPAHRAAGTVDRGVRPYRQPERSRRSPVLRRRLRHRRDREGR